MASSGHIKDVEDTALPEEAAIPSSCYYVSLRDAGEVVHAFDGSNISVQHFIESCRLAADLLPKSAHLSLVNIIKTKLQGEARNAVIRQTFATFEDFVTFIRRIFGVKKSAAHCQGEMANLLQKIDESVLAYANRALQLESDLSEALVSEGDESDANVLRKLASSTALASFIRGLRSELEIRIHGKSYKSLAEAVEAARSAEEEVASRRMVAATHAVSVRQSKHCNYCERDGHVREECRILQRDNENGRTRVRCQNCGQIGHLTKYCRKRKYPGNRSEGPRTRAPRLTQQ